jgi:hypothetical protein
MDEQLANCDKRSAGNAMIYFKIITERLSAFRACRSVNGKFDMR